MGAASSLRTHACAVTALARWRLAAFSVQGRRRHQEDSLAVLPQQSACVLADGMGGVAGGALASRTAVATVESALQARSEGRVTGLRRVVGDAHRAVRAAAAAHGFPGSGTTLTLAQIRRHHIWFAHVGDTRAYLWYRGRLTQITRDHTVAAEQALHREAPISRHFLSRALGQDVPLAIDLHARRWQPGHTYLLCSDGLHGTLSDREITLCLRSDTQPEERLEALVGRAYDAGSSDNISAILIEHEEANRALD